MEEMIVTSDLQTKRETLIVFSAYLLSVLGVCPLWHGRHPGDNPFPPLPTAACHDWFL